MSTAPQADRRLGTIAHFARHREVNDRTVRYWVKRGHFPVYRVGGVKGVVIDFDEADRLLSALPAGTIKPGFGSFGPNADVRTLGGAK